MLSLLLHIGNIKFSPRTIGFARIFMLIIAQDFDLHDFSAISSLALLHSDSKIEMGLIFLKAWL